MEANLKVSLKTSVEAGCLCSSCLEQMPKAGLREGGITQQKLHICYTLCSDTAKISELQKEMLTWEAEIVASKPEIAGPFQEMGTGLRRLKGTPIGSAKEP